MITRRVQTLDGVGLAKREESRLRVQWFVSDVTRVITRGAALAIVTRERLAEAVRRIDTAGWRAIVAWHSSIRHPWSEAFSKVTLGIDQVDPKLARSIAELEQAAALGYAAEAALKEALLFVPRHSWIGPLEKGIAELALGGLIVRDLLPSAIFDSAYDPFVEAIPLSARPATPSEVPQTNYVSRDLDIQAVQRAAASPARRRHGFHWGRFLLSLPLILVGVYVGNLFTLLAFGWVFGYVWLALGGTLAFQWAYGRWPWTN
jgi:hypothetical protein